MREDGRLAPEFAAWSKPARLELRLISDRADGGRFCDDWRSRALGDELLLGAELPRLKPPFAGRFTAPFCGELLPGAELPRLKPPFAGRLTPPFCGELPARPDAKLGEFMLRTMCEVAATGAVRATTWRFWTDAGGVETRPPE